MQFVKDCISKCLLHHHYCRALVKNLFIGYFHTPNAKRKEVLHVIASVLGLTEEEMKEVGSLHNIQMQSCFNFKKLQI